jgi:hypothetical protein
LYDFYLLILFLFIHFYNLIGHGFASVRVVQLLSPGLEQVKHMAHILVAPSLKQVLNGEAVYRNVHFAQLVGLLVG